MRKAFNLAVNEWEWLSGNPVSRVPMERENNARDRLLTEEEEKKLLKACEPWLVEIVKFGLHTRMRLSEVLTLSWKEVDLFRKTVMVTKSKNNEKRTIPINETVLEMLKQNHRRV
jgi:integrase